MIVGALTACGGGSSSSETASAGLTEPGNARTGADGNTAPAITGTPSASAAADQSYNFQPTASDGDNDRLSFTIANKPAWATFNAATGKLTGVPAAKDVGTYKAIEIAATDGKDVATLPAFTLVVATAGTATGSRAITLAWDAPTENADGSTLTDLTGYKIHYGTKTQTYTNTITVSNPGVTNHVVQNLANGTYFFAVTAYNATGGESAYSTEFATTLN